MNRRISAICVLTLAACGGAPADSAPETDLIVEELTGDHPSCTRRHPDLSAADTDGDGMLSTEERQAFRAARIGAILADFDVDQDGELSADEREAVRAAKRAQRFTELDTDDDERLSEAEVADACRLSRRFDRLDADSDGYLSLDEFSAERWRRRRR